MEQLLNRDETMRTMFEAVVDVCKGNKEGQKRKEVAELLTKAVEYDVEERSRIIGRALQSAK